jgi:hypothetical protein
VVVEVGHFQQLALLEGLQVLALLCLFQVVLVVLQHQAG